MQTKHLYLMPGMAASPRIFEFISMPDPFEIHLLSWFPPEREESLSNYAKRMCTRITHPNPILLGVSFGGVLVQEMAHHLDNAKLIIVSSIKSNHELSPSMKIAHRSNLHKLLPTQWIENFETLALFAFGDGIKKRVALYKRYLSERDSYYLSWSINALVHWKQEDPPKDILHIHGKNDTVFPPKHLVDPVLFIEGGHAMIINKSNWFNKNLPRLIFENSL